MPGLLHVEWNAIAFRYMFKAVRCFVKPSDVDSWAFNWNLTRKFYHSVIRVTLLVELRLTHQYPAQALAPHAIFSSVAPAHGHSAFPGGAI